MALFFLYIFTLFFNMFLSVLVEYLLGNVNSDFDNVEDNEAVTGESLSAFLFQWALYGVAIVFFVILPAVAKGKFLPVVSAALILSIVVNIAMCIVTYSGVDFYEIKEALQDIGKGIFTTILTGIAGYYLMLYVLL